MTRRRLFFMVIPLIAVIMTALTYLNAFSSPYVIAGLVVLYVVVSVRNRRRFARRGEQKEKGQTKA